MDQRQYASHSEVPVRNIFTVIMSRRETLLLRRSKAEPSEASKERDAAVKAKLQRIQVHNPGRKPDWTAERLEQVHPVQCIVQQTMTWRCKRT